MRILGNSHLLLSLDLASANVLVWIASFGRKAELTRDAHLYFFDRYSRLADYHRARGHVAKARHFEAKAHEHHLDEFDGDPPFAAAMAMPRPRRFVYTDAVGRRRLDHPDDAA
jgi:hypothetical protein